jgi:hypothetical protein
MKQSSEKFMDEMLKDNMKTVPADENVHKIEELIDQKMESALKDFQNNINDMLSGIKKEPEKVDVDNSVDDVDNNDNNEGENNE